MKLVQLLVPSVAALLGLWLGSGLAAALEASVAELRRHVEYLSSDQLEGRLTGSDGARKAAAYLVDELESLGARPLPGQPSFELPFEFTAGSRDVGSLLTVRGDKGDFQWNTTDQIQALSFSEDGSITGPVVFAGYGLVVPESRDFSYDSYANLNVEDKVVLVLRYFPEEVDQETRSVLARYSGLRYKAMQARKRGARAFLVVTGPNSPNTGTTVPMTFEATIPESGIVAASIGGDPARTIFESVSGMTLEQAQSSLDDGNPHVTGFDITNLEITVDTKVERQRKMGRNIVGYLPGPREGEAEKPFVILGAHYDHLGRGQSGNSLAKEEEEGRVHNGADDNASGVAAALAVGGRLALSARARHIVLAFWSGEELGLLGSSAFLAEQVLAPDQIAAYVNFDMVGRMQTNRLSLQAVGSSSAWPRLIEQANVPIGFDLQTGDDPNLPTDSTSFNQASIPTIHLFTGCHEDYHRPSDTPEKINFEDLDRVARLGGLLVGRLANLVRPPDFVKVEPKIQEGGGREGARAFTGTIPDYAAEVDGLRLSGVVEGGPADEAGLQKGDVVVELAGQSITDVYDYSDALDAVKIGVPVRVVFLRDGERREATMTPQARK